MSKNTSSSGVAFPRHNATMAAAGNPFSGSVRTLSGSSFPGTATASPTTDYLRGRDARTSGRRDACLTMGLGSEDGAARGSAARRPRLP